MSNEATATPILKSSQNPRISKRLSVTFSKNVVLPDSSIENTPSEDRDSPSSPPHSISASDVPFGLAELTPFGLTYTPLSPSKVAAFEKMPLKPGLKLQYKDSSQRPEMISVRKSEDSPYNIVIIGDCVHSNSIKNELERQKEAKVDVSIIAHPTKKSVSAGDFYLIILPLEIVGSCNKVLEVLTELRNLRSDYMFRCALVCVSLHVGTQNHLTEMFNLHTMVVQHKLPYYVWNLETPGSFPVIVERILEEVRSCRGSYLLSRECLTSLLSPSDGVSYFMHQLLDRRTFNDE